MNRKNINRIFLALLTVGLITGTIVHAEAPPLFLTPSDIKWTEGSLPGSQVFILEGDPKLAETFTLRIKLPANYKIPPHWHPGPERVTVLSGTLYVGHGDLFDSTNSKPLPMGSFMVMSPMTHHFAWTNEETIIQITGIGPWKLTFVNPADDPRKK